MEQFTGVKKLTTTYQSSDYRILVLKVGTVCKQNFPTRLEIFNEYAEMLHLQLKGTHAEWKCISQL